MARSPKYLQAGTGIRLEESGSNLAVYVDTANSLDFEAGLEVRGSEVLTQRTECYVESYGAIADYSLTSQTGTDNTTAVQAAINAALEGGNGGVVRFGPGRYYLPAITSLDPGAGNLVFEGAGAGATFIHFSEGTNASPRYLFKNIQNTAKGSLTFRGLHFVGTLGTINESAGSPFWLDYYSPVDVVDCHFSDISAQAMWFHYIKRFRVSRCAFKNIGRACAYARDSESCIVTDNHFERCGDDPVALHITTNTIETYSPPRSRMIVANNTFVNCNGSIAAIGAKRTIVHGNIMHLMHNIAISVYANYLGVEGNTPQYDVLIANNVITDMVKVWSNTPQQAVYAISFEAVTPAGGTETNGVIPGEYDAVSGALVRPFGYYDIRTTNTAKATPRVPRVRIINNTIGRTLAAVSAFSDYGYGSALWQAVAYDPAITESVLYPQQGINVGTVAGFVGLDVSGNKIENCDLGLRLPIATDDRSYQNTIVARNQFFDCKDRAILVASSSFTHDILIEGNTINGDPYRRNSNSNVDGSYDADTIPYGIDVNACKGIRLLNNTISNVCRAISTNAADSVIQRANTVICGQPAATGFSTSNKGIGNIPTANDWRYVVQDCDPTSGTFGALSYMLLDQAAAMPSTGWYPAGFFVRDTTANFLGWKRITTGTGHTAGTDWRAIPIPKVLTVATLPTASAHVGSTYIVSDANATTFASIVAGGGANAVPVYSDGTNWRIG